jgi:hypothetical protein
MRVLVSAEIYHQRCDHKVNVVFHRYEYKPSVRRDHTLLARSSKSHQAQIPLDVFTIVSFSVSSLTLTRTLEDVIARDDTCTASYSCIFFDSGYEYILYRLVYRYRLLLCNSPRKVLVKVLSFTHAS